MASGIRAGNLGIGVYRLCVDVNGNGEWHDTGIGIILCGFWLLLMCIFGCCCVRFFIGILLAPNFGGQQFNRDNNTDLIGIVEVDERFLGAIIALAGILRSGIDIRRNV